MTTPCLICREDIPTKGEPTERFCTEDLKTYIISIQVPDTSNRIKNYEYVCDTCYKDIPNSVKKHIALGLTNHVERIETKIKNLEKVNKNLNEGGLLKDLDEQELRNIQYNHSVHDRYVKDVLEIEKLNGINKH